MQRERTLNSLDQTSSSINRRRPPIDRGYSWVIAFASATLVFFQVGLATAFGVFVPELEEHLQISASTVGLCASIGLGLRGVLGPVWAALNKIISCRQLIMSGGILSCLGMISVSYSKSALHLALSMALLSIGSGLPSVTKVVQLKKYFDKKFNIAVSLVFAGGTISLLVLPPAVEYLVISFGWRGAMLIFGAINLQICVAGILMIEPPIFVDVGSKQSNVKEVAHQDQDRRSLSQDETGKCSKFFTALTDSFGFSIFRQHRLLVIYMLAMALHELVFSGWALFLISYTLSRGFNATSVSFLAAVGGGGAIAGRLSSGPVMTIFHISGVTMFCILAVGGAVSLGCYPLCKSYIALSGVSLAAGLCLGSTTPVYMVIFKEIFRDNTKGFAAAVGLHSMFRGIGMLAGGPITGLIYDASGSFQLSFATLAILEGAAAVMTFAMAGKNSTRLCTCSRVAYPVIH